MQEEGEKKGVAAATTAVEGLQGIYVGDVQDSEVVLLRGFVSEYSECCPFWEVKM